MGARIQEPEGLRNPKSVGRKTRRADCVAASRRNRAGFEPLRVVAFVQRFAIS
jgi:hypothetical protein